MRLIDLHGDVLGPLDECVALADGQVSLETVSQGGREDGDRSVAGVVEIAQHQSTCAPTAHERLHTRVTSRSPRQPRLHAQPAQPSIDYKLALLTFKVCSTSTPSYTSVA